MTKNHRGQSWGQYMAKLIKPSPEPPIESPHIPKARSIDPSRIGELGEYKLDLQLRQFAKPYRYLNDVFLANPGSPTGYSRVDHILVTPYAIFVIETKNYGGSIRGERRYAKWLVNGKPSILNPLRQNYGHIKALQRILREYRGIRYISMVSLSKRCTINVEDQLRSVQSDELIVYDLKFTEYVQRKIALLKSEVASPLSAEVIHAIVEKITAKNVVDPVVRAEHVQKARGIQSHPCRWCKTQSALGIAGQTF